MNKIKTRFLDSLKKHISESFDDHKNISKNLEKSKEDYHL